MEAGDAAVCEFQFVGSDLNIFPGSVDKFKCFLSPLAGHFQSEFMPFCVNFHVFYNGDRAVMIDYIALVICQVGNGNRRVFRKHISAIFLSDTRFCIGPVIEEIPCQRRVKCTGCLFCRQSAPDIGSLSFFTGKGNFSHFLKLRHISQPF